MKTLELKLKKDVLIVEIPRLADYEFINRECKYLKVGNEEIKLNASTLDKFEFLCKGSELTEEIASELVEKGKNSYGELKYENHYDEIGSFMGYDYALPSFISAIESKGFHWLENPIYKILVFLENVSEIDKQIALQKQERRWQEAEEKTFRNPLIFVKK